MIAGAIEEDAFVIIVIVGNLLLAVFLLAHGDAIFVPIFMCYAFHTNRFIYEYFYEHFAE